MAPVNLNHRNYLDSFGSHRISAASDSLWTDVFGSHRSSSPGPAVAIVRRNAQTRVMEALTGLMGFWGVLAVMFAALAIYVFDIGGFQKRKFEEEEKEVRGLDFKRVHGDLCCCTQCGA